MAIDLLSNIYPEVLSNDIDGSIESAGESFDNHGYIKVSHTLCLKMIFNSNNNIRKPKLIQLRKCYE